MGNSADYSLYFVTIVGLDLSAKIVCLRSVFFFETDEIETAVVKEFLEFRRVVEVLAWEKDWVIWKDALYQVDNGALVKLFNGLNMLIPYNSLQRFLRNDCE